MTVARTVEIEPAILNITLYGDGNPWNLEIQATGLGDITGAVITAKLRTATEVVNMTAEVTDGPESKFRIGHEDTLSGEFDISIALPGGDPRTYISGSIDVNRGRTS